MRGKEDLLLTFTKHHRLSKTTLLQRRKDQMLPLSTATSVSSLGKSRGEMELERVLLRTNEVDESSSLKANAL